MHQTYANLQTMNSAQLLILIQHMAQQVSQHQYFTKYLSPANEIITKKIEEAEQTKIIVEKAIPIASVTQTKTKQQQDNIQDSEQESLGDRITLANGYSAKSLVYKKYANQDFMERSNKKYFASIFTNLSDWPEQKPYSIESNGISFSSQGESMNLFAVFQTGPAQFDLILQNDLNTCGYTQWFYFAVHNKNKNQMIKINIVNLYKSKSLYNTGMKPLALSKKSGKGWQRAGTNVIYTVNQLNIQYTKKFYRTLSFQHTFLQENNQTQFAHCFPYPYSQLKQKLKCFQKNPRVKIRSVGLTCMGKSIPLVQFSQEDSNPNKKSIVIMARQHPGQTVGSLIMDQIMSQLSRPSTQNQFLLWRFNIYCIPMINVDGVILGNYRGNAHGFDLNRCWDRDNSKKLPQLFNIKKQIKKIQKKYPIQLILDLHGHSRKMGSFFYGNPFGKNTGLYAYISSRMSPCISFQDSTFQKQKSQKLTTARIVLGNIIKDSGCFYTYQTSFFGSIINNKKTHFNLQNFQILGRTLINSIYKTFVQIQKQQKTLKQSLFLREARKQLSQIQQQMNKMSDSGSDSEAQQMTLKQMSIKNNEQNIISKKNVSSPSLNNLSQKDILIEKKSIQIQVGEGQIQYYDSFPNNINSKINNQPDLDPIIKTQFGKKDKRAIKIGSASQKFSLYVGFQKSQQLTQPPSRLGNSLISDPISRKNYLMQKLRVFGETFIQNNPKQTSKQTQTGNFGLNIQNLNKKLNEQSEQPSSSPLKSTQYRKRKSRNKSLIIRVDNKDKLAMADIVKVNKLQYRRIKRDSMVQIKKKSVTKILPNII